MQRIAYWSIPIIAIVVTVLIILFLVQINTSEPTAVNHLLSSSNTTQSATPEVTQSVWLDRFSQSEKEGYFYPVNEIFITLDLHQQHTKKRAFALSAFIKNQYQLFCLQEELKQRGFHYFLKKVREGTELLVYSKDQRRLQSLVEALKSYKITAEILPYEEVKNG